MSPLDASSTLTDVAFTVCTALERAGEHAVLCGGSAATYYAPEAYESRDLDFVLRFGASAKIVDEALRPLGYLRAPERLYRHPGVIYTVEFPVGPLSIGSETITTYATAQRGELLLHVYSPTDVVRDRFMHYWAWGDQRALRIALDIAAAQADRVDVAIIEKWTEQELRDAPVYDRGRRDYFLNELQRVLK
ncbi:MAG TPA: hypothetical protein VGX96_01355 [Candidatus Elarobacter sp.]|jgi:hypothetical protein|nr:hypothetical protein [Candidatus Elarobacter sp.]